MSMFKIIVEKRMTFRGEVVTDAVNEKEAIEQVRHCINNGDLQTTSIVWEESEYEDDSFKTYGEVYKIMRKKLSRNKILEVTKLIRKYKDLNIAAFFIMGMPEDTIETLRDTYNMIKEISVVAIRTVAAE